MKVLLASLSLLPACAWVNTKPVIAGYDVVAYFGLTQPELGVKGSPAYTHTLLSPDADGSPRFNHTFWFSSAANRDTFAADPWKYAPRFGGF